MDHGYTISIKQENEYEIEYKGELVSNVISDETGNVGVINIITSGSHPQQIQLDPHLIGQQIILQQQIHPGEDDGSGNNSIVYITSPVLSHHQLTNNQSHIGNDHPPPLQLIQASASNKQQHIQHIHVEQAEVLQMNPSSAQSSTQNFTIHCKLCKKKFNNLDDFQTHMHNDHLKNNVKIEMVTMSQDTPPPLQLIQHVPHLQNHSNSSNIIGESEIYEVEVVQEGEEEEEEISTEEEPNKSNIDINIVCKVCKETFSGADNLTTHMETHTNDTDQPIHLTKIEMVDISETQNQEKSSYPCAFCPKKYLWHKFLVTHSKVHKIPGPFVCSICGENCDCLYFDHMKTHVLIESRDCSKCEQTFASLKLLKEHMNNVHEMDLETEESKHKCDVCGKRYKALSYLKEHERIHTGEKPYTCDVCGKGFAKYGCFAEHKKTHQVQRAFKCPMCIKAFTKRRYLKAHLLRHPKTADFDKYFVDDVNGETPLRKFLFAPNKREPKVKKPAAKLDCAICFKEFKKLRYLKAHIARHPDNFVRQKLGILPGAPIPALISSGSFDQNRLSQTNKNSLINFDNTPTMAKKPLSSDEESSSEESSSDSDSVIVDDVDVSKEKGEMILPQNDVQEVDGVEETTSTSNQQGTDLYCSICHKPFDKLSHLVDHEQVHVGESPLKCKVCNATFVLPSKYADHMIINHNDDESALLLDNEQKFEITNRYCNPEEKSYTCFTCGDTFFNERILEEHEEIHVGEEPFKCKECGDTFAVLANFTNHQQTHHVIAQKTGQRSNKKPEVPKISQKVANPDTITSNADDEGYLEEHFDDGGSDDDYEPVVKPQVQIEEPVKSTRPKRAATGRNKWKDTEYEITQPTRRKRSQPQAKPSPKLLNLKPSIVHSKEVNAAKKKKDEDEKEKGESSKHISENTTVDGKKRFKCKICDKQYTTAFYLREHLSIHSGKRPHKCEICGKTFAVMSCYREHVELHTNKKQHKCKECGVTFAVARYLKAHMRRHAVKDSPDTDNKFYCDQCGKNYRSNTALKDHMRIHTGEAPFNCSVCQKEFMLMASLREHMRKHETSEYHACPFCPKTFALARYLQQHLVRHIQKIDSETNGDVEAQMAANDGIKSEDEEETDLYVPSADGQTLVRVADVRKKRKQK